MLKLLVGAGSGACVLHTGADDAISMQRVQVLDGNVVDAKAVGAC